MSRVFISHSRVDAELTKNLATMLRNIGETPVVMEYVPKDGEKVPPYARIKKGVTAADYVMLFKTDNAIRSEYTKNWIIFEVGIAATQNKRLFVFERRGPPIQFPIPYVTDYMIFDPNNVTDFLKVQSIAKEVKEALLQQEGKTGGLGWLPILSPHIALLAAVVVVIAAVGVGINGALHGPINIDCPHCYSTYRYYAGILDPFQCPACLEEIDPSVGYDREAVALVRELKKLASRRS